MPPDLTVTLGRVALKHPVICGSGEHTATLEGIVAAIDAGAAAVVAKSANESDAARAQFAAAEWTLLDHDWTRLPPGRAPRSASVLNRSGLVPVGWEEWLETLGRADAHARRQGSWVVASLIPADPAQLGRLAADVEDAGLRWLELNLSAPHAGESTPGAIERVAAARRTGELTARVRASTTLPLTVTEWDEWGDPLHDPETYWYIKGYSPYENVAAADHPPVLAMTSLNDTRVLYVEPAKWVARLRASTTGPSAMLLKTEMVAGHAGKSGRYEAWRERAYMYAWVVDTAGAPHQPGATAP
jgi:hypothetical protein